MPIIQTFAGIVHVSDDGSRYPALGDRFVSIDPHSSNEGGYVWGGAWSTRSRCQIAIKWCTPVAIRPFVERIQTSTVAVSMAGTASFIRADFAGTLFPMKTNLIVLEHYEKEVAQHIATRVLAGASTDSFLPQQRVHATKPRGHLRRTVKLDPVAEYFLYDTIYRNRAMFRAQVSPLRQSFGYRFENGGPIPVNV